MTDFDVKVARVRAWDDFLNAPKKPTEEEQANAIARAWASGAYIKEHEKPPPDDAIPAFADVVAHTEKMTDFEIAEALEDANQLAAFAPDAAGDCETFRYGLVTRFISPGKDARIGKMIEAAAQHFGLAKKDVPEDVILGLYNDFFSPEKTVIAIHKAYVEAETKGYEGRFPFAGPVEAWQNRPPEIEATTIYDARRPAAILRFPRGNFTVEMFSDSSPGGSLKRFADDSLLPQSVQMILPGIHRKSVIRNPSKMFLAHVAGVPTTTRKGAVSSEVRVCVEALTQTPPKERMVQVHVVLGDLIERIYPNGFNWTNQAPKLIAAIRNIDNLRVPFRNTSGRIQTGWAPVTLNTKELSRRDDDVVFTVSLPEDAIVGPMVEKKYVRLLGLISAPKWQAYFALCDLFHRRGLKKGKNGFYLADPTKPVERRNEEGYLLNAQGEVIRGTSGEPLIDPYGSEAVKQLEREDNQEGIDEYPIVPFDDMLKAAFPGRVYKSSSEKAEYLKRAKKYFRELADLPSKAFGEKKGKKTELKAPHIIKINEEQPDGWQFLPGESHVAVYRGVSTGGE